jgi:hypothetical protein
LKKKGIGSEANTERMSRGDVNLQLLNPAEQEKHLKKQRKRSLQGREEEVLFFCFLMTTFLRAIKTWITYSYSIWRLLYLPIFVFQDECLNVS